MSGSRLRVAPGAAHRARSTPGPQSLVWPVSLPGGTGDGITGIHEWVFTATPAGTHVETTESFAGAPVEADVAGLQQVLDGSLVSGLNHLKNAAQA